MSWDTDCFMGLWSGLTALLGELVGRGRSDGEWVARTMSESTPSGGRAILAGLKSSLPLNNSGRIPLCL